MAIWILDNYDSFTYNLVHQCYEALQSLEQVSPAPEIHVVRNDATTVTEICNANPSLIILSPGPGSPSEAGIMPELIETCLGTIPLFGVCLGMQALAAYRGVPIRTTTPVHGKLSSAKLTSKGKTHPLLAGLEDGFSVVRYHSLHAAWEPEQHRGHSLAETEDGILMAYDADAGPAWAWGVQFHPESIGSQDGQRILLNVLDAIRTVSFELSPQPLR